MKPICYLLIVVAILLLNSCSSNKEISATEKQLIVEELQKTLDVYAKAFKNKDIEGIHNFWSKNPDFVFASDGKLLTDYDSVITYRYPRLFNRLQEVMYFDYTNGHGTVLSREAASLASNFDIGYVLQSGDTVQFRGTWLFVFKKFDEQWSVVQSAGTHIIY